MTKKGFLGIDAGTQGLSVVFIDENLNVLATGEGQYEMITGLAQGCYEQLPGDWESALQSAMNELRRGLQVAHVEWEVLAIGISGQMHGEVLADADGNSLGPTRLWCDSRNEQEGRQLTECLSVKMPKRITAARWLWTLRQQPEKSKSVVHLTTPAGWLANRLTGQWNLGIGDASGMFPMDQATGDYDQAKLKLFDELVADRQVKPLASLLPKVRRAGEEGGCLDDRGAALLGLPEGIPVAPAEGDQPTSLAGALIGKAGMVSVSFGTSVCANSVGDREFQGVSNAVDHFCAPDGKPINMVWLRNGTTFLNTVVGMFGEAIAGDRGAGFEAVVPRLLEAEPDCGGLLALPFMDDEPGLGVDRGGTAMFVGLNPDNSTVGNVVKAALLSTMFNLRLGSEILDQQGFLRAEIVLSGGLTKTPELGQLLADVFNTPVVLPKSAIEGCAWGAALLAKYRLARLQGESADWSEFLAANSGESRTRFEPQAVAVQQYDTSYFRYKRLMGMHADLERALINTSIEDS
jgi:sugar (pentulose or hexulose) kinase